ncbi:MAG TPA: efflux RND transporter periplasmic adaptor subunit [Alphaproteobacteria bacterium]|nr:efflux RND transporter periplasmic adaptor subunit [Alphaproteobacteria bacterium]
MSFRRLGVWTVAAVAIVAAGYGFVRWTSGASTVRAGRVLPPAPVTVARVTTADVPVRLRVVGTVQPVETVAIKSRVDGQIVMVHFTEGQMVKKGDRLFSIDARPFEWQLRQAEANLARDRAQLVKARADLERIQPLWQRGVAPKQNYDAAVAGVNSLLATIQASQATIEQIKLQIEFAAIRAPIDGKTGAVLVHAGNLVKANDTGALVVINKLRPIDVTFAIPERHVEALRTARQAGAVAVNVTRPDEPTPFATGKLIFVNNAIDAATGTIRLKARFANVEGNLVPGRFVGVQVTLAVRRNALVVPSEAVQVGQRGRYVFVVKADRTVEQRMVRDSVTEGGRTVIESGLKLGETVVTDGQLRLFPGIKVMPRPPATRGGVRTGPAVRREGGSSLAKDDH